MIFIEHDPLGIHHIRRVIYLATNFSVITVGTDVEDMRLGTFFRTQHLRGHGIGQVGYFAGWIIQITKDAGAANTSLNAGRNQILRHTVMTEGALVHHTGDVGISAMLGQHEARVVRAGSHTCLATDAAVIMLQHETAIIHLIGGPHRTCTHARWIITVVTQSGHEHLADSWVLADNFVRHPSPENSQRHIKFSLTSYHTGITAYATTQVDNHGIALLARHPPRFY